MFLVNTLYILHEKQYYNNNAFNIKNALSQTEVGRWEGAQKALPKELPIDAIYDNLSVLRHPIEGHYTHMLGNYLHGSY